MVGEVKRFIFEPAGERRPPNKGEWYLYWYEYGQSHTLQCALLDGWPHYPAPDIYTMRTEEIPEEKKP